MAIRNKKPNRNGLVKSDYSKLKTENKELKERVEELEKQVLNISVALQRTFLFSGWYAGEKFEIKINAVDRESAIADFETTWIHHKWHITQEID